MKNFDTFIGIDWSGAKAPVHTKAISVARCAGRSNAPPEQIQPSRHIYWSRHDIGAWIKNLSQAEERVFIGIDANFGYSAEVVAAQFGPDATAHDLWAAVNKACTGDHNYFAGAYWKAWPEHFWWEGKQPVHITLPRRVVENACGEAGLGWPESPFKLIGAKQVGKGGLAVMRMAHDLKQRLGNKICIWPFERDIADTAQIVISEIYPRQFLKRAGFGNKKIRNASDLNNALSYFGTSPIRESQTLSDHNTDALISAAGLRWLCGDRATIPSAISHPSALDQKSSRVEGWIFGVGAE